jgi:hypothetical protein
MTGIEAGQQLARRRALILQCRGSRGFEALEPLVADLAADAVALARLCPLIQTRLAIANEPDALLHG